MGKRVQLPPSKEDERVGSLRDALVNINRSATKVLDVAGVPDELQGDTAVVKKRPPRRPNRPFVGDLDDWYKR